MDIITHTISGIALNETLNKKRNRILLSICIIAGIFPDIDAFFRDTQGIFQHRLFTHSLLFIVLAAAPFAGVAFLAVKKSVSFANLYLAAFLGMLLHLLLDAIVVWGVPFLYPINDHYFSLRLYSIIYDPYIFFPSILLFPALAICNIKKEWRAYIKMLITAISLFILLVFVIRFIAVTEAKRISQLSDPIIVPVTSTERDIFLPIRLKAIEQDSNMFHYELIDIVNRAIYEKGTKERYLADNRCGHMHQGYLFTENELVGDIRYAHSLTHNTLSCFFGTVALQES